MTEITTFRTFISYLGTDDFPRLDVHIIRENGIETRISFNNVDDMKKLFRTLKDINRLGDGFLEE